MNNALPHRTHRIRVSHVSMDIDPKNFTISSRKFQSQNTANIPSPFVYQLGIYCLTNDNPLMDHEIKSYSQQCF